MISDLIMEKYYFFIQLIALVQCDSKLLFSRECQTSPR